MASHKAVTLKDVADLAKVSQSVVSTVLNGRQNGIFVSESTRRNVLSAAEELGYMAKHRAVPPIRKPLADAEETTDRGESRLVGLLLGRRFAGSLFTDIFYGVNSVLAAEGYHPIVLDTYADTYQKAADKEAEGLRYAQNSGFSGIVLWHEGGSANVSMIQHLRDEMPIIAIDRRVQGVELDYVGTDNYAGGYEATRHLIKQGHTRIAHLTRLETTDAAVGRLRGYQQALTDAGLEVNPRNILLALDGGRRLDSESFRHVFSSQNAPTAIFLLADFWAPVVYNELRNLGLRVPQDVSIVGFDDVVQPGLEGLSLTTMAQNFEAIGITAGQMALRRIRQPDASIVTSVYPAKMVVRHSTQAPRRLPERPRVSMPQVIAAAAS